LAKANPKPVAYYAHCMLIYNTPIEKDDIELIESLGFKVINPNQPEHEAGYKSNGMEYFDELVRTSDILFFRAMPDGRISSGVAREIEAAEEDWWPTPARPSGRGPIPVLELPSRIKSRTITPEETRQFLYEAGERSL